MAKKRIPECTRDASEADFKSDNFLLIDGVDGSAKLEMELVGKQSSINTIGNSLTAEIERATNEEASIRTAVTNETNRASAAEGNLNTAIVEETTRATGVESNLNSAITAEVARATGVESSLDSAITAEVARATGAEGGLDTAINTEVTRAKGAEGSLSTALTNEITRASGAEGDLRAAITAEYNRATGAESSLSSEIATKESIISDLSTIRTGAGLGATALQSIVSATGPHYNTYSASGPTVTSTTDTSAKKTTLTFDYMKGPCGPKGDKGDTGLAAGFASAMGVTTNTGAAGSSASVIVTPDSTTSDTAKKFNFAFTIPRGEKGETGPTGPDGNIGIAETTNTSDITLKSNQRYKLSVGSKSKVFTTPSGVSSVTFDNNQLRVVTDGSISKVTVPYAASAGSATTATSATEVYNKVGNAIIAAGTNGISITDGVYTSVLAANTLSVGNRSNANVGTIGCGTLNATTGIALLTSGGQVKANITSSSAVFNVGVSTSDAFTATGNITTTAGGIYASNGVVYAKTGLNTDSMVLARKGIMVVPENGTTKGFGVDIADDHNVFNVYGSTNISMDSGSLILGNGSIYLLNGGKVHGTATNAESLNGWSISVDAYSAAANTLSFV